MPPTSSHVSASDLDSKSFEIVANIDRISNGYLDSAQSTLNKLITAKVELYKNKNALEDKLDELKEKTSQCDSALQSLTQQN